MKKFVSVLLLASIVLALTACNTIEGVGKDVQKAGEAVEDAAKD
jgi:entericidin B